LSAESAFERLDLGARSILGRPLVEGERQAFRGYLTLLQKWQRVQRLVGSTEAIWVIDNLFLDSLLFLRALPDDLRSLADLGSGAGFPGLPIKIVRPSLDVLLIESRLRRVSFLSTVVRELGLAGVSIQPGRAEALGGTVAPVDAVVMRCAGDLATIMPSAEALLRPGGVIVVAGPPQPRSTSQGEWVDVESLDPRRSRRFLIYRPAEGRRCESWNTGPARHRPRRL
jgi:16S rRNA (guanine(527)-N(7))-methyltransferase RsmG